MSEATLKSAEIPAKCNLFRVLTESLWERLLCCNVTSGCGGWIPLQIKPNCTAFKVTALFFFLLLAPFESPTGHKHTTLWQKTQFVFALLGSGEWGSNIIMLVYRWCAEVCYMNSCRVSTSPIRQFSQIEFAVSMEREVIWSADFIHNHRSQCRQLW